MLSREPAIAAWVAEILSKYRAVHQISDVPGPVKDPSAYNRDSQRLLCRSFGDVGPMSGLPESGHGWAIEQRCAVLLLILSMTLTGLVIDKARAGEQTRLYRCRSGPGTY